MKKALYAGLALAALAIAPASAADLGQRPYYKAPVQVPVQFSWTGFYIGGFVGGAWSDSSTVSEVGPAFYNGPDVWTHDIGNSFIGGGTIGYNWQAGNWVFGLEGEAGYLRLRGSGADPFSPGLDTIAQTRFGDWYGIIAGRVGVTWDRVLIYAKGGVAFINNDSTVTDACNVAPCGPALISTTGSGNDTTWTVGGGIEYALNNNWSIKGEYMFIDTKDTYASCGLSGGATFCWNHNTDATHTAKFGINYRWGAPVVARY